MSLDFTNRKSQEELDKLPAPTNENLKLLFHNIDKIVIKDGGVYQDKAITNEVILIVSTPDQIEQFHELLQINEAMTGFYCMCPGNYALELYTGAEVKATIGLHHGISIRYDNWNGDALLTKNQDLLNFFASLGFTQPLNDFLADESRRQEGQEAERRWLLHAPKCFEKYWSSINDFNPTDYLPALLSDFETEVPEVFDRIRKILTLYGSGRGPWSGFPAYEEVCRKILDTVSFEDIIASYQSYDKNDRLQLGLGRYLRFFDYRKKRKKYLLLIPHDVIDDIERCVNQGTDPDKIFQIKELRKKKMQLSDKP